MAKERWASRAIVNILIEQKNFSGAADVVSGCKDVFGARTKEIHSSIAEIDQGLSAASGLSLQQTLDEAADEIRQFRDWELDLRSVLLKSNFPTSEVRPLIDALEEARAGANFLDALVIGAFAKYFSAKE